MPQFTLKRLMLATAYLAVGFAVLGFLARDYVAERRDFASISDLQAICGLLVVCGMPGVAVGLLWNRADVGGLVFVVLLNIALWLPI